MMLRNTYGDITIMAMHNNPSHDEAGKRVELLFDGKPTPKFYKVIVR
jgi:hypothetical protein